MALTIQPSRKVNLAPNPFMSGSYTGGIPNGWNLSAGMPTTIEQNSAYVKFGTSSCHIVASLTNQGLVWNMAPNRTKYRMRQVWVYVISGQVELTVSGSDHTRTQRISSPGTTGWVLLDHYNNPGDTESNMYIRSYGGPSEFHIDSVMYEEANTLTWSPFTDVGVKSSTFNATKVRSFSTAKTQSYFKELVVNGDFSQGSTGWNIITGNWDTSSGKAVLSATGNSQSMHQLVTVTPNTVYELRVGEATGSVGVYNKQGSVALLIYSIGPQVRTFNSGNNTQIRVYISSDASGAGTFTFDNISLKRKAP